MAVIEAEMQPAIEAAAVQATYDYARIEEGVRDEVKQAARAIRQLERGVVTGIVAIGKRLHEVKGMLPYGQFVDWIEGEFSLSERMAEHWMNVARVYGDPSSRNTVTAFSPSTLFLLAAPSTSPEVRELVETRFAETGKPPTRVEVKRLRDEVQKPAPPLAREVYVEPMAKVVPEPEPAKSEDAIVRDLLYMRIDSETFGLAMRIASIAQLEKALKLIPPVSERDRFRKVGDRYELLLVAKDAGRIDALIEAAMPIPVELTEFADPDEATAVAAIEAEAAQEDAERLERDSEREPFERVAEVDPTPPVLREVRPQDWESDRLPDGKYIAKAWPVLLSATDRFDTPEEAMRAALLGKHNPDNYKHWIDFKYLCGYAADEAGFKSSRDSAPLWLLKEALAIVVSNRSPRKSVVQAMESRIRKLEREQPQPKPSSVDIINRDLDAYEAEAKAEVEQIVADRQANDSRLGAATMLRYMLQQARQRVREDFPKLTGRDTLIPPFERAMADLLEPLDSLIAALGGEVQG